VSGQTQIRTKDWCSSTKINTGLQKAVGGAGVGCTPLAGVQGVETMSGKLKADTTNNYAYNKKLQPFANKLRKEMTKTEACLWKYALRASQMKGYQFRRQRPVLRYIADFLCKELKLVIEVDGITLLAGSGLQPESMSLFRQWVIALYASDGEINDIKRGVQVTNLNPQRNPSTPSRLKARIQDFRSQNETECRTQNTGNMSFLLLF